MAHETQTATGLSCMIYDRNDFTKEAKAAVKGKGRYAGWAIRCIADSQVPASLLAYYYDKAGNKAYLPLAL